MTTRSPGATPFEDLHLVALAHADLHLPSVRDVVVVDHQHRGAALFAGQDRGRRHQVAPSMRRGDDRRRGRWRRACSRSPGLSACTQTCTVVLFGVGRRADDGDLAGAPLASPSAGVIVAGLPTLTFLAWSCAMLTRATTFDMSITVSSGAPGVAISPG